MRMKLAALLLAATMMATPLTLTGAQQVSEQLLTRATVVVELDEAADTVTVEDSVGFLWSFEGIEDWCVGDGCCLLLYDNGTPDDIRDDIIVQTTFYRLDILASIANQ